MHDQCQSTLNLTIVADDEPVWVFTCYAELQKVFEHGSSFYRSACGLCQKEEDGGMNGGCYHEAPVPSGYGPVPPSAGQSIAFNGDGENIPSTIASSSRPQSLCRWSGAGDWCWSGVKKNTINWLVAGDGY